MKKMALSGLVMLISMIGCSQEKKEQPPRFTSTVKAVHDVPFLTKAHGFVYVNKDNLKPVNNQHFKHASAYTPTGFAVVGNEKDENAVIDESGKIVMDYTDQEISLGFSNGLTFYKKEIEYEKKMPFYKWEWNILGGGIKKEQIYRKTEIGILESNQILLKKDIPYLEDYFYLNFVAVDENHVFWNETLYKIKNNRLNKIESDIVEFLENNRYLKGSDTTFTMYALHEKKTIHSRLTGTETLPIRFGQETIVLKEVNKERYEPTTPKLLVDSKTNDIYVFPQYEKVFPKEIKQATASQIEFIKKTSLVYSIHNSPYFLLGAFNNDDDVWAYEWLYIDTAGNVLEELQKTYNFKILDQIGSLVWPDRKMIFPDELNTEKWKFGKIHYYGGSADLYLIPIENQKQIRSKGLWNNQTKSWEIKPEFHDIFVLDTEKQIYTLQQEEDGSLILYDNKAKKMISSKTYQSIRSDGLVSVKNKSGESTVYYIDIYSGKEYKEN